MPARPFSKTTWRNELKPTCKHLLADPKPPVSPGETGQRLKQVLATAALFESETVRRKLDWFIIGHGEDDGFLVSSTPIGACGGAGYKTPSPAGFKRYAVPPSVESRRLTRPAVERSKMS
jgi:hypothetical protein